MAMDSDDRNPDAALHVRFQMLCIYQPYDSTNPMLPDGKTPNPRYTGNPVYRDIPHIEITTPGGLNRVVEQVRPDHKARFKVKWEMFEMSQGQGDQIVGTKLEEWPQITRSRAEELRAMKYFVVEQLAEASDQQVQGIGMDGMILRNKAKQFLKVTKETALAERLSADNANKQAQLDAQAEQLRALQAQVAALAAQKTEPKPEAKRRGRPPKVEEPQQSVEA